jgi:rod shape-determining protein MreD
LHIRLYLAIPVLTIVALLQNTWLSRVNLWGARPDLMLQCVLAWTTIRGINEGIVWGFIGGLLVDLLSGGPLGVNVLALLAVAFVGSQPWGEGLGAPLVRVLLLALVSSLVCHVILLTVLTWTGRVADWSYAFLRVAAPSVGLNVLAAPLSTQALRWVSERIGGGGSGR